MAQSESETVLTEHHETDNQRGEQRVQEDSLEAVQVLGQTGKDLLEQQDDIASEEAADDTAQEAETHTGAAGVNEHGTVGSLDDRQALNGDHTGDKAGDERRALADGLGDVGGKHRNHEVHGDAANDLEHRGKAVVVRSRRIEGRDAPQERNGSQNTTSNDEDQHVADAVHEVLIDDVADGLLLLDLVLDIGGSSNRVVALGGERAVD